MATKIRRSQTRDGSLLQQIARSNVEVERHMNEELFEQILNAFDGPEEKIAFYMGLKLAMRTNPLAETIVHEMERRWRIVSNNKSIKQIEQYVNTSIDMLVAEYRSKLQ